LQGECGSTAASQSEYTAFKREIADAGLLVEEIAGVFSLELTFAETERINEDAREGRYLAVECIRSFQGCHKGDVLEVPAFEAHFGVGKGVFKWYTAPLVESEKDEARRQLATAISIHGSR
jgi:hypothetical protein